MILFTSSCSTHIYCFDCDIRFCDGGEYLSNACSVDGGDCDVCIQENGADSILKLGDGKFDTLARFGSFSTTFAHENISKKASAIPI